MDETEFGKRAADALRKLDDALRDVDGVEFRPGRGHPHLEFEDGSRYVANSHAAAQQIWLSANLMAWHFGWHDRPAAGATPAPGRAVSPTREAGEREGQPAGDHSAAKLICVSDSSQKKRTAAAAASAVSHCPS